MLNEAKRAVNRERQARWLAKPGNRERKRELWRAYYRRNPGPTTERKKRWLKTPKGQAWKRRNNLKRSHGITVEQYDAIFAAQGSRCATCGTDDPGVRCRPWHLDHDHDTGAIRGILCQRCNLMVGLAKDKISTLLAMVRYLKNPPAQQISR